MGGLTLDTSLTSRDEVKVRLRVVLDEVAEKWGVRVNRVELKDIQLAMEKQMQAEWTKRATILTAEGDAQAAILRADGHRRRAPYRVPPGEVCRAPVAAPHGRRRPA